MSQIKKTLVYSSQDEINSFRVRLVAVLISACFILYYSTMPVVLGRAAASLGLQERELGLLAGTFACGVALASFSSLFFIRKLNWRQLVWVSGVLASVCYLAPLWVSGFSFLLICHLLAGFFGGIGYSVSIACLGDTAMPTRSYAMTFLCHTLLATVVSVLLPRLTTEANGFNVALLLLAAMTLLGACLARLLPQQGLDRHQKNKAVDISFKPPAGVIAGLIAIMLVYAGDGAVWAFVERIAVAGGLSAETGGLVVAASLLAGAAGSAMAGLLGIRLGYVTPMVISIVVSIFSVVMLQYASSLSFYVIAIVINGWAWNFGSAYRMGLVAELDTTGRFTPLIPGTQTLGSSFGPVMAGLLVVNGSFVFVYIFASLFWMLALLFFLSAVTKRQCKSTMDVVNVAEIEAC